jgi:hypothetical protein
MGRLCVGQGGTVLPEGFLEGTFGDAYLDWSKEYPGSQAPPPPPPQPPGDLPLTQDMPPPNTNMDAWALGVIANAWRLTTGEIIDPRTALVLAAFSRSETFYGWPLFPQGEVGGRDARSWWGHHNWAAINCYTVLGGRPVVCYQNGGCVTGFLEGAKRKTAEGWSIIPVCYEHQDTNLQGAIAYIRAVLATGDQAAIRQVLRSGSAYDVAITFRMRGLVLRTDNADARGMMLDAAYYAERIMRAARTIAVNAQIPMVLEAGIPAGLSGGATDPSEPPSLTDYPAPPKGSIGPVQAVLGTAFGIAMGVAGAWAWAKVKG